MNDAQQFLLYTAPSGAVKVQVSFKAESVWLTQKSLAELFGVKVPAINKHLKNIFESGELIEDAIISILETTAANAKMLITSPTLTGKSNELKGRTRPCRLRQLPNVSSGTALNNGCKTRRRA